MKKITTIAQVEALYNPEPMVIKGMPEGTVYPLPAGTPFFIAYLKFVLDPKNESNKPGWKRNQRAHGLYGTHEVDPADQRAAYERLRSYEFKRLHRWVGKSINTNSPPINSIMLIANMRDGVKHWDPHLCDCGGKFIRAHDGCFWCDTCGIDYSWEDDEENASKTSLFNELDNEAFIDSVESEIEEAEATQEDEGETESYRPYNASGLSSYFQGEQLLGGLATGKIAEIENRLERNIAAWKASIGVPDESELKAKDRLHKKVETTKKVKAQMRKDVIYNSRINKIKQEERRSLLMFHIKNSGFNTASKLSQNLGLHHNTVVRLLTQLEKDGKIVSHKEGKERVFELA